MRKISTTIICMLLLFSASCTSGNEKKELVTPVKQVSAEEKVSEPSKVLTLRYLTFSDNSRNAVREFETTYPDTAVEYQVLDADMFDEFRSKLTAELMAGEGPDVIVFSSTYFESMYKVASSGVFTDLNKLIEKDTDFNMEDYRQGIMNDCLYGDKRLFIPLRYDFYTLCTSKSVLEKNNLHIDLTDWTWESLNGMAQEYMKSNGNDGSYLFDSGLTFRRMLSNYEGKLVDYENKKSSFNSAEFLDMLQIYKDMYPAIAPVEIADQYGYPARMLKNGAAVFEIESGLGLPGELLSANSIYMQTLGEEVDVYPMPMYNKGGRLSSVVGDCVAINEKCDDKAIAYNFIKLLMSENMQRGSDNKGDSNLASGAPISKNAYIKDIEREVANISDSMENRNMHIFTHDKVFDITIVPMPGSIADNMNSIVDRINNTTVNDNTINSIIDEAVAEFIKGGRTVEQTAKVIEEKADLFLNE